MQSWLAAMAADCRIGSINAQGPALPARRRRVLAPLRAGRRQQTGVDLPVTVLHEAVSLGELPHHLEGVGPSKRQRVFGDPAERGRSDVDPFTIMIRHEPRTKS